MVWFKNIDKYFWVFLSVGVLGGFVFPDFFQQFEGWIVIAIMVIMGLLYLKVDIVDVVTHVKNPFFLLYVCFINLIGTPVVAYFLFSGYDPKFALGVMLLGALPSGVSSAAFTDIMEGRTSLTLTIIILSNLLSTITIPLLFWFVVRTDLGVDLQSLFMNLLMIIFVPFFIAKFLKYVLLKRTVAALKDYYNAIILAVLSFMMMVSFALQADYIIEHRHELFKTLLMLFVAFFVFQLIGYFSVFWHKKGEKLAIGNSNMIINNILGIVLALAFFDNYVVTLVIISFIPWSAMIVAKHWFKRFLP